MQIRTMKVAGPLVLFAALDCISLDFTKAQWNNRISGYDVPDPYCCKFYNQGDFTDFLFSATHRSHWNMDQNGKTPNNISSWKCDYTCDTITDGITKELHFNFDDVVSHRPASRAY
ncbi:hypothetical protein FPQ18DRAFT_308576 [Pyronema domesticum]|nr:hypothetical protein FPQ18DRAFT_308576 [Pyronema domesticum]